ncbi:AsmA-like C-terminal region-containing protein [Lunatimonas salinarum]|uniref:AsmA-like C-terminal region-containing protein n=1 Tax=Lunatimonas salinarum TaxID=1774590 RepID=UPI001AE0D935|nr:AsmA-like C-terminal region-containing protein [Lunatimonas salinarum]
MKKIAYIILTLFTILLIALISIPWLFKDRIIQQMEKELATSVNAKVFFDYDKVGLSAIRRFPNITATLGDFGIVGNEPFASDTLVEVGNLRVDLNLFSVLFKDYPELTGIRLEDGNVYIKVLSDGQANYDITFPSEAEEETASSEFRIGVNRIEVENLGFIYDDRELDFFIALGSLDLQGEGDFTLDVYDLAVSGRGDIVRMDYEGANYLYNKKMAVDTKVNVNLDQMVFSFGDGALSLNDFGFGLDGSIGLPDDGIAFDLDFYGVDNTFKSLLSLIPGMYTDSFSGLKTSGQMNFEGFVRGLYTDDRMPAFQLGLEVVDGKFQYPDLPRPVQEVHIDLLVDNPSGVIEQTSINLSDFRLRFGDQPISGRLLVENLVHYDMDGQLSGKVDLAELTSIFPLVGMQLKGSMSVDAAAQGRYDSAANMIPRINANVILADGYVKSVEYPAVIEDMEIRTNITNTSGRLNDLLIDIPSFGFKLDGEPVTGSLSIRDLDKLIWDLAIHGSVDFGKMMAIFPMEDVIMEGKIRADIDSEGSYADVEAARYDRVSVAGDMMVSDFFFASSDLPQGIRIREASTDFSPNIIELKAFDARLGKSPVTATGRVSNYLGFLFGETGKALSGNLDIQSSSFNVNEWLTSSDEPASSEEPLQVVELPRNVDFNMSIEAGEILYDNLILKNARGVMNLQDGILSFRDFSTNTLGGQLGFSGSYNSQDVKEPLFDFVFDVNALSVQEAFRSFNTVQAFAPVAEHVTGSFTTRFGLSGILGQDMMPVLSSLDGKGLVKLAETAIRDSQLIKGITTLTKLNDTATLTLRPFNVQMEIQDGMLKIPPFDLQIWGYESRIQGSTGFDGSISYLVSMQVPAEKFGSQINSLVSGLTGTDLSGTSIPLAINIGGTYGNPKIGLATGEGLEAYLTNTLRSRMAASSASVQEQVAAEFQAKEDSLRQEIKERAEVVKDSVKAEAERVLDQTKEKAAEEVRGLLRGLTRPKP